VRILGAFADVGSRIPRKLRIQLLVITSLRMVLALLDLIGVVFIAAFSASSLSSLTNSQVGERGEIPINLRTDLSAVSLLIIGVASLALKSICSLVLSNHQSRLLNNEASRQIGQLARSLFITPQYEISQLSSQELHFLLTAGVRASVTGLLGPAITLVAEVFVLFLLIGFLMSTNFVLSSFILTAFGGTSFLLFRLIGNRQYRLGQLLGSANIQSLSVLQELTYGYREFWPRGTMRDHLSKFEMCEQEMSVIQTKQNFFSLIPRHGLEILVMVGLGAIAVATSAGSQSGNSLILLVVFATTAIRILPCLIPIQASVAEIQTNLGIASSLAIVRELTQKHVPMTDHHAAKKSSQVDMCEIKIRNLVFRYKDSRSDLISCKSLDIIGPGLIAVTGPSGSGKSTFFDLVLGIKQPSSGSIQVNRLSPNQLITSRPGICGYLPQRITGLNLTLAENVAFGSPVNEIDESRVLKLLKDVGLSELIDRTALGIWTPIGELANSISGGQMQRLGIARCLYTSPQLLLIDEATSGLDLKSRTAIVNMISQLAREILVIAISHQSEFQDYAKSVLAIEAGQLKPL